VSGIFKKNNLDLEIIYMPGNKSGYIDGLYR
jgi:hypothetical protein